MPPLDCLESRQSQLSYHRAHNCVTDMLSGPVQEHVQVVLTIVAGGLGLQQAQEGAGSSSSHVGQCSGMQCALVDTVAVCAHVVPAWSAFKRQLGHAKRIVHQAKQSQMGK